MLNKKLSQNEADAEAQHEWNCANPGLARLIARRKQLFEDELKDSPPEPPWEKHPGYARSDLFWRTGAGNQYLMEYIWPYNRYATKEARLQYRKTYPEPESWVGWYSE